MVENPERMRNYAKWEYLILTGIAAAEILIIMILTSFRMFVYTGDGAHFVYNFFTAVRPFWGTVCYAALIYLGIRFPPKAVIPVYAAYFLLKRLGGYMVAGVGNLWGIGFGTDFQWFSFFIDAAGCLVDGLLFILLFAIILQIIKKFTANLLWLVLSAVVLLIAYSLLSTVYSMLYSSLLMSGGASELFPGYLASVWKGYLIDAVLILVFALADTLLRDRLCRKPAAAPESPEGPAA